MIFQDENSRRGYDLALKRRPFDELIKSSFEKIASKKSVAHEEYIFSIERAREVGFSQMEAEWYVYEYYCKQRKLEPPKKPVEVPQRLQCPECFHLNDVHAKVCKCGIPLRVQCPRCKREGAFGDLACTQCGFPIGNMPNAVLALEKARKAILQNEIEEAERLVFQINSVWRDCPGAEDVRHTIKELKAQYTQRQKQIRDLETQIRTALGKRHLFEARRLFNDLRKIPDTKSVLADEEKNTSQILGDVQSKLNSLPSIHEIAEKIDLCEDILALAADCKEARDALEKYPPLPPSHLSATLNKSGAAELTWQGPPARKQSVFVVVRKIGAAPASPTDGEVLNDSLSNTTFVDSRCDVGVIYGYAVFTKRDRIVENKGCRSDLLQRIDNLARINTLPGNGSLTFSWTRPPNSLGIRITRFEGDSLQGGGTKHPIQRETSFVDTGLKNGETYTYLFQTIFRGIDGQPVETSGTRLTTKPQLPPPAVIDLQARDIPDDLTLFKWTPPQRGELLLYDLTDKPDLPVGQVDVTNPLELKKRYGEPIPLLNPRQGQTRWRNLSTGLRHILPITFLDGLAVYGKSISVVRISEVENLHAKISGPKLFLMWDWPKGLEKVLVTYHHDHFPEGPSDTDAVSSIISRKEYDIEKAFVLSAETTQDFYFRVHAFVDTSSDNATGNNRSQPSYSRGVETKTTQTTIRWRLHIRRNRLFWGKIESLQIKMAIEEGQSEFPNLMIKKDIGRPPLNRKYGTLVMEIPACNERLQTVQIDPQRISGEDQIRLFVKDEGLSEHYALYGPSQETMRLHMGLETFADFFREFFYHPIRFIKRFRG